MAVDYSGGTRPLRQCCPAYLGQLVRTGILGNPNCTEKVKQGNADPLLPVRRTLFFFLQRHYGKWKHPLLEHWSILFLSQLSRENVRMDHWQREFSQLPLLVWQEIQINFSFGPITWDASAVCNPFIRDTHVWVARELSSLPGSGSGSRAELAAPRLDLGLPWSSRSN